MAPIEAVSVRAYTVPTESPESDGTLEWNGTTMVYVEIRSGGVTGIGYPYGSTAVARFIEDGLSDVLLHADALDTAAWGSKGKIVGTPLYKPFGNAGGVLPLCGSGGFTSFDTRELTKHMSHWVDSGIPRVKMKIGRRPEDDEERVAANGAYSVKQALAMARTFEPRGVSWFEEPVYHRDLTGNATVCAHAPPSMEVSNGEYGYAADVIQADVPRCGGFTGFAIVDTLCETYSLDKRQEAERYAV